MNICHAPPFAEAVLHEATRIAPDRDRETDGTCPSVEHHEQNPDSDHEPSGPNHYCHAVDITQDPDHFDAHAYGWKIAQRMAAGLEHRVKYLVSNNGTHDVIFDPAVSMTWRENGTGNEHRSHLHVSYTPEAEQSTAPFFAPAAAGVPDAGDEDTMLKGSTIVGGFTDTHNRPHLLTYDGHVLNPRGGYEGAYPALLPEHRQEKPGHPRRFRVLGPRDDGKPGYQMWNEDDYTDTYRFGPDSDHLLDPKVRPAR